MITIIYLSLFFTILTVGFLSMQKSIMESLKYEIQYSFVEKDYEFMMDRLFFDKAKVKTKIRIVNTMLAFVFCIVIFDGLTIVKNILTSSIIAGLIYKLHYFIILGKFRRSLKKAEDDFPFYLNSLTILIQNNTVVVSLLKSIELAPEIFKRDLNILVNDLHEGRKEGLQPYNEFANKFKQVKDLNRIMKTLFNLSFTISNKEKIMTSLTKLANEKVNNARKETYEKFLDKQALIPWVSFLWVGLVIIAMFSSINLGQVI